MKSSLTVKSHGAIRAAGGMFTRVAEAIDDLLKGHNNVADPLGVNLNGPPVAPPSIAGFQASHLGNGLVDLSIVDQSPTVRGREYHVEYSLAGPTGKQDWTNPRGLTLGPWRTGTVVLPNGTYYLRAYSQQPVAGPPSSPVVAQGPIQVTGSSSQALFPSQSSGTGLPGTGGGEGSGKAISRS